MTETHDTLIDQALALHRQGDVARAADLYVEALRRDPQDADAHYYLAMIACQEGRFEDGITFARKAIAAAPARAAAHNLLGMALHRCGRPDQAVASFDAAIARDPNLSATHGNRGSALIDLARPAEALESFDRALALDPNAVVDWCNRGMALELLGRADEAIASFAKSSAIDPQFAEAHINRGGVLAALDRDEEALAAYDAALAAAPGLADAHAGRGGALRRLGRIVEAQLELEMALGMQPAEKEIAFSLAQLLLLRGDWLSAWPLYERRGELVRPAYQKLPHPRWNGEPSGDYRLLLVAEGSFGQAVMFARFARLLVQQGYRVTILAHPVLAPVLAGLPGLQQVVSSESEMVPDPLPIRWAPLNSVAAIRGITPASLPHSASYIGIDPARVEAWATRLGPGAKIGVAWQASSPGRSIPLADLAPLAGIPGVRLVALQHRPDTEECSALAFGDGIEWPITRDETDAESLVDVAALMLNLDAVVACDGTIAHLAGALGRSAYIALRAVSDWPWLLDRADTPWYPTIRLFRQRTRGDWNGVIEQIAQVLRAEQRS